MVQKYRKSWYKYDSDEYWKKREAEDEYKIEKAEFEHALKTEELGFDVNYITKPIRSYGHVARKINQILVTGIYQHGVKYYPSPQEERKAKSEKAFRKIMARDLYASPYTKFGGGSVSDFQWRLTFYGKDISEKEHAPKIVRRLRSYERDKKRELEGIQKVIRDFEDRFPSIVEDPSAFEVEQEGKSAAAQEKDKK